MATPQTLSRSLRCAAALRPDTVFARIGLDEYDQSAMTTGELEARANRHAAHWRAADLGEGARVVVVATPEPEALAAIVGAIRAGLEVSLAAPGLDAQGLAEGARDAGALALAGPGDFAGLDFAERLTAAAALTPLAVRLAVWGGAPLGAIRFDSTPASGFDSDAPDVEPSVGLLGQPRTHALDPVALAASADKYIRAAGLTSGATVLSLVSLSSVGGLVCGALAPLASGASTLWQAPFSTLRFAKALLEHAPVHLVAPGAVVSELGRSGLLSPERVATLTLLVYGDFDPIFDHDLEPERVFLLETETTGAARLTPLSKAFGETLE